jgi:hypothetical protein
MLLRISTGHILRVLRPTGTLRKKWYFKAWRGFLKLRCMNIPLRQVGVEDTDIKSIAFLHCKTFSSIDDVAMTQSVVDFCSINEIIPKKKKGSQNVMSLNCLVSRPI